MECFVCKGELKHKLISHNIQTKDQLVALKNVPALVCDQCGEVLFTPETVDRIVAAAKGDFETKETMTIPLVDFDQIKVA